MQTLTLADQINLILTELPDQNPNVILGYQERLAAGALTRDENKRSHVCAYFLPYNSFDEQVFIIHHKKSGLWLSPGGHVDRSELLLDTLNREIEEELGVKNKFLELPKPFFLSITPIENTTQPCKEHFDIWYLLETDGKDFKLNPDEFYSSRWVSFNEAPQYLDDPASKAAIDRLKRNVHAV